jgi:hypothetical protein
MGILSKIKEAFWSYFADERQKNEVKAAFKKGEKK